MTTTAPSSHNALGWLSAALGGALSAASFTFAAWRAETMLIFLIYLAALPLFTAGLGTGYREAVLASLIGLIGVHLTNHNFYLTGFYALAFAVPTAVLSTLALRYRAGSGGKLYWYPEGHLMTAVVLYPCLVFIAALIAVSGEEGGLLGLTAQAVRTATEPALEQMPAETVEQAKVMIELLPRMLPGLTGCSWIFLILISLVAAQSTLKGQNWNRRKLFAWRDMTLPNALIVAAAAAGVAGVLAPAPYGYAGSNLCFILCLPFFFTGLAVVHTAAAAQKKGRKALLVTYYILLCIPHAMLLTVIVTTLAGALDQGVHFRERLRGKLPSTQGENR